MKIVLAVFAAAVLFGIATEAKANLITNGSFEITTPTLSANEICASFASPYPSCAATGWSGAYQIGRGATHGAFGSFNIPQPDPNGSQALIIEDTSYATQSVTVATSGLYALSFYAANRSTSGFSGAQTLEVLLNNVAVSGGTYSSLPFSWTQETLDLNLNSGVYSLTFEGTIPGTVRDVTAFVDDVSLVTAQTTTSMPEPSSLSLIATAGIAALTLYIRRCKTTRAR